MCEGGMRGSRGTGVSELHQICYAISGTSHAWIPICYTVVRQLWHDIPYLADVVAHVVRILRQVDRLQSQTT